MNYTTYKDSLKNMGTQTLAHNCLQYVFIKPPNVCYIFALAATYFQSEPSRDQNGLLLGPWPFRPLDPIDMFDPYAQLVKLLGCA